MRQARRALLSAIDKIAARGIVRTRSYYCAKATMNLLSRTLRQMITIENYLAKIVRASIAVSALWSCSASAETPCFRIQGLKYVETVHLDVTGAKASGDYLVDEYGENAKRFRFTGKVIPSRGRKKGVYVAITFNKEDLGEGQRAPYQLLPAPSK
jgi:hypothetical protein